MKSLLQHRLENHQESDQNKFLRPPLASKGDTSLFWQKERPKEENWLTQSADKRKVMLCRQVEAFWRRGRIYKFHPFFMWKHLPVPQESNVHLCACQICLSLYGPLLPTRNLCNYKILLLQGKNITCFVLRLISCSVARTIHKSCSELQVVEAAAASQTTADVQQVTREV